MTAVLACSAPAPIDDVGSMAQSLSSAQSRVLGFESVGSGSTDWTTTTGTVAQSTRHVEGLKSLAFANGTSAQIRSAALSSLGPVADKLTLDLLLPAAQPNPSWMGSLQLVIECPSQGLPYQALAQYQLQGRPTEQFLRFEFPLTSTIRTKLSTGTYSDLRFNILLNVAAGPGPWLLDRLWVGDMGGGTGGTDGGGTSGIGGVSGSAGRGGTSGSSGSGGASSGSGGASSGGTAGSSGSGGSSTAGTTGAGGSADRDVTFRIVTPKGVAPAQVAVGAVNSLRLNDSVSVVLSNGTGHASASSAGNPGSSFLGVNASLQNLWSIGSVELRDNAKLWGNLTTSGSATLLPGASILGTRSEGTNLVPRNLLSWKVSFPLPNAGNVSLEPDQVRVLPPGNYGSLAVKARARVKLQRGTYRFETGAIEPTANVDIDNSAGPVFIYFRSGLLFSGVTNFQAPIDNVLFGVNNLVNQINSPWKGLLVANGTASLVSATGIGHEGSIFADDVVLHQSTPFRHRPFVPSQFCDAQNPMECGPFCPCGPGGSCDSTLECQSGLTCVAGTCGNCADGGCDGDPCTKTEDCEHGLVCAGRTCHTLCSEHPETPGCISNSCANGVKDAGETGVDCGGTCPPCRPGDPGDPCAGDRDCEDGLKCGTNNGGYFCGARGTSVCWPAQCQDGVDPSECGSANSPCGPNCPGVVECGTPDPAHPSACPVGCPAGEQCKAGFGRVFGAPSDDVCLTTDECPSNAPEKCGTRQSLCGERCICTPDCSHATAANPKDGCGGECPHICPDGGACCSDDLHCAAGSMCQPQESGPGICRPGDCRYKHLAPPLCGTPGARCGDECPTCVPACGDRQCGLDPRCGVSCGTCAAGTFCSAGQCLPGDSDPPLTVPDGSDGEEELPELEDGPTAAVGAVPGQFSVSDQGTAQYNIPIDVPPGRAGMEPALSLRYAATKSSGEAGMGWKIEGLSQITRCPHVHALDGYATPIRNDTADLFCIDGKRLELVPGSYRYGTDGAEYRTVIDTFVKVVSRTEGGDGYQHPLYANSARIEREKQGPDYFQVWMKDGRILTYGRSLDSLVMARNGVRYTWLLNRVEDRVGNNIVIEYSNLPVAIPAVDVSNVPNVAVPKAIYYTGHGATAGNHEVLFDYEERHDPQLSYAQGGAALAFGSRLRRITTKARGLSVKNYRLEYEGDNATLLKKVFECVGDSTTACKPPTEFEYKREAGFTQASGIDTYNLRGAGQLDVNGDGKPDFMLTTGNVGNVKANPVLTAVAITADAAVGYGSYAYLTPVGGMAVNAVYQLISGAFFGLFAAEPKVTFTTTLLRGRGDRASPLERIDNVQGLPCPGNASFFVDYNQDGKDDVLSLCPLLSMRAGLSSGSSFDAPGSGEVAKLPFAADPPGSISLRTPVVYDVNGDSLQDIVSCVDNGTLEVRLRRSATEGFETPILLGGERVGSESQLVNIQFCSDLGATYQIFDIDGDGTPELLTYFNRAGSEEFGVPAIQGWFALRLVASRTVSWQGVGFSDIGTSFLGDGMLLGDLNGDGLTDIWRDEGGDSSKNPRHEATVWLNGGGRFLSSTLARPWPFGPSDKADLINTALIDYDADGRLDVLQHWLTPSETDGNSVLRPDGFLRSLERRRPLDMIVSNPVTHATYDGLFDAVGDLDADGNPDVYGAKDGTIYYGSGLHNMLLSTVKDGLGNLITVEYDGSHDGNAIYATTPGCTDATQWPDECLKTMKGLVSRHSEGAYFGVDQTSIERTYDYKYVNGRMNLTGHGWLGFDQRVVTESDGVQYTTVTTEFEPPHRYTPGGVAIAPGAPTEPPYLYPLAGLSKTVTVDRGYVAGPSAPASPIEDAPHSRRAVVTNNWDVKLSADSRPFPVLKTATTETFSRAASAPASPIPFNENGQLRTSCSVFYSEFDGYGNHTNESSSCYAQGAEVPFESTQTTTEFSPLRADWLISNVELLKITSTRFVGPARTQVYDPAYDSVGQLIAVTRDPGGDAHKTSYTRDAFGNVEIIEESAPGETPRVTHVTYGVDHVFPIEVTNAKGHTNKVRVRARDGQISTATDPNGVAVRHRYDGFGRRVETHGPSGVSLSAYTPAPPFEGVLHSAHDLPRLTVISESLGSDLTTFGGRSVQVLDHSGRPLRTTSIGFGGDEVVTERAYDGRGRVASASVPHLALPPGAPLPPTTFYEYDYLDRVTKVQNPDGTFSERQYASGVSLDAPYAPWLLNLPCWAPDVTRCGVDVELSIDSHAAGEPGLRNVIIKDHAGLIVRSIDGENVDATSYASHYFYGAFNRLYEAYDNGNAVSHFDHDAYGRLISQTDPDSGESRYTYSRFGELQTSLDPSGQLRTYGYDVLGRPERILDHDGLTTWTYDEGPGALGKLSESASPATLAAPNGQHVRYRYEPAGPSNRGLLERITYDLDDSSYPFDLHYDPLARIESIDYPHAGSTPVRAQYHYEPSSGALISLTENGSGTEHPLWKIDSTIEGYLVGQQTFGNGAVSTFSYDPDRLWLKTVRTALDASLGDTTIQDLVYDHYDNGQLRERVTLDRTETYTYDALGRIATQSSSGAGVPSGGRIASYAYDAFGNLTQNDTRTNVYNFYPTSHPHLVDIVGSNGYFHDANGNVKSRQGPDIPGSLQSFSYTPFDLPRTITTFDPPTVVELDYTADGTRVVRRDATTTQHFASQLYERSFSSTGTLEEHFRFAAGGDHVAETIRLLPDTSSSSEKTLYFHADHLGTPETISDDSGNYEHQYYDPFGNRDPGGGPPDSRTDPTRIGFTGQLQDSGSRLIDMGGRVYDPLAGRFTTADPIMQAPFFSQGLNRYAYVFNDPLNNTDPSGYSATGSTGGDIATGAVLGVGWGLVGYGVATELGIGPGAVIPGIGGSLGNVGLGTLSGLPGLARAGGGIIFPPAPTATPVTSPNKVNGPAAPTSQSRPPGPNKATSPAAVQERSPESYAAGPKNSGPEPVLCQSGMFECDYEAQTMRLKTIYVPLPDGAAFVQVGQAVEAAIAGIRSWFSASRAAQQTATAMTPQSAGAMAQGVRVLQTGGNTIRAGTANSLNEYFSLKLHPREWGRAIEALKAAEGYAPDFHGSVLSNGNYLDKAGRVIGNVIDFIP